MASLLYILTIYKYTIILLATLCIYIIYIIHAIDTFLSLFVFFNLFLALDHEGSSRHLYIYIIIYNMRSDISH